MSEEILQKILKRLGSDPDFRKRMCDDAATTLGKDFPNNQLTEAEKLTLIEMAAGFANDSKMVTKSWWKPTSFKEIGGAVLSIVLLGLLIYTVFVLFGLVNVLPQAVTIGGTSQVVDTYSRAKDLFSILFPLFAAVITFWLGTAVEGHRADQNEQAAAKEGVARANAENKEQQTKSLAGEQNFSTQVEVVDILNSVEQTRTKGEGPNEVVQKLNKLLTNLESRRREITR